MRIFNYFLISVFLGTSMVGHCVYADEFFLPKPGIMLATSVSFSSAIITGMTIHPENPLQFDFIVDTGDNHLQGEALKKESQKLINYFMATLTVPEEEMWVNLSPYEENRIIADGLGNTEMGRDMLAQDYILKQFTASLIYPESQLGKEFWVKIYAKAKEKFGTTEVPTNLFNKVWIIPQEATVYVNGKNVFVTGSHLKVMLEQDYLSLEKHNGHTVPSVQSQIQNVGLAGSQVVREIILPAIEKEVNEGKNFANLRQIYNSMILATWYKKKLKKSLLSQIFLDQNKTNGIDLKDKSIKEKIYKQYLSAYKKGVYNYIKEEADPRTQAMIPRKYFSGGLEGVANVSELILPIGWLKNQKKNPHVVASVKGNLISDHKDNAMLDVTLQEALDYQKEVEGRFNELDLRARQVFDPILTDAKSISDRLAGNVGNNDSVFYHVQVSSSLEIRQKYQDVQKIIRDVLGKDVDIIDSDLSEIHVTITNPDIASHGKLSLTLEELVREIGKDTQGVKQFHIQLVGPHLMSNGAIIMEYTTDAPEFLHLRKRAEARLKERKERKVLSEGNKAFVPNIIHSTVALIRDRRVSQQKLQELFERLNAYRQSMLRVDFETRQITATYVNETTRRFIQSKIVPLSDLDTNKVPYTDKQVAVYTEQFFEAHRSLLRDNQVELLSALADPHILSIPLLPPVQLPDESRRDWVQNKALPYGRFQRDFINTMDSRWVVRVYTPKLLRGQRGEAIKGFLIQHLSQSKNLTPQEQAFIQGLRADQSLEQQGVQLESLQDYSSSRVTNPGAVVYRMVLLRNNQRMVLYLKGADKNFRKGVLKPEFYEEFFNRLATLTGLNAISSYYYPDKEDPQIVGFTLMQEVRGDETNQLFNRDGLKFKIKPDLEKYKVKFIEELARFGAISDLINKGDRRIIQNKNPQFSANHMVDWDKLKAGQPAMYSMDHGFLFNLDNQNVIADLESQGNAELGIVFAFPEFKDSQFRTQMFSEFEDAYCRQWEEVLKNRAEIENVIVETFGENSFEHQIFLENINQDPHVIFQAQKEALLKFADHASVATPGGIDLNSRNLDLKEQGRGEEISFSFEGFKNIQVNTVRGVSPVITQIIPVADFASLLS